MTENWGKYIPLKKKKAPRLNEIMIEGKIFVLREDGLLVLKSMHEADKK